ncbi:MAG: SusD/RagB family nutrient-binding outer membrane lipoprotein, partial [Flavobacteriales bacterium]|nr:SusD/RagB family nutrient-binding outer membrane lipoprotein [Flavobacteriales bacterium]
EFEGPKHISSPVLTWDMPVILMSQAESELLQSEAYFITGNDPMAKSHYEAGVTASFAKLGLSVGTLLDAGEAYAYEGSSDEKYEKIILQKWVDAAWGQRGIEAFIERNRTGIPYETAVNDKISAGYDLDTNDKGDATGYVSGTLVYSKLGSTGGKFPVRLPYAAAEMNYNSNSAEYKSLPDATVMQTKVWWNK